MSWNGYETNNLLRNEGPGDDGIPRFTDVAMALGADDDKDARGLAIADFDNDGDLDLAVSHDFGDSGDVARAAPSLLRNDIGNRHGWISVELEGTTSNRDAVGALVTLEAGDLRQVQVVSAGSSYASQHDRRLHFGLGDRELVDRLTVRWPGGGEETFTDLPARSRVRIVEGQGIVEPTAAQVVSAGSS
ncbi:MAG: CRTAC1 family protein [Acidobacteria bacterium]|nr:CRTAC1 family protein [Acidobacteriota bacterium]